MNKAIRTEDINTTDTMSTLHSCRNYIDSRHSSYEFRSIRYEAVFETLVELGFRDGDSVLDVGGGDGEFGKYLREQGCDQSYYCVVDGYVDGTDLNRWCPFPESFKYIVAIEVIEHLMDPKKFLNHLAFGAINGVVVTTPNPLVVDVLAMDTTHISPVFPDDFLLAGYEVDPAILFFQPADSLIGVKDKRHAVSR